MKTVSYEIIDVFHSWKCPYCNYYPNEEDYNFSSNKEGDPVACENCGKQVILKNEE